MNEESTFRHIFWKLISEGIHVTPRGQKTRELENYQYELEPYDRFCNFEARKLNLSYIKQEFLWYLKGDPKDLSIAEHAKIWSHLVNSDGTINSNYGQYIFGEENQFSNVVGTLANDKDSRRAIIMILNNAHLKMKTKDVPCTISMSFRIRENKLNMTVRMRSQDAILGMGNDAPAFIFIHEMVFNSLLQYYPDLKFGTYVHSADSFHIYEKHFEMAREIVDSSKFVKVDCPKISGPAEVRFLRKLDFATVPEEFRFTKWLLA